MIDPQPLAGVPVKLDGNVITGPDGQPWVQLRTHYGFATSVINVTEPMAVELATLYPQMLTQLAANARRAKLGLILPCPVDMPPRPDHNGRHPTP